MDTKKLEEVSKQMGWWSPDGFDAYPERTTKVVNLIQASVVEELEKLKGYVDHAGTGGSPFQLAVAELATTLEEASKLSGKNNTIYQHEVIDWLQDRIAQLKAEASKESETKTIGNNPLKGEK